MFPRNFYVLPRVAVFSMLALFFMASFLIPLHQPVEAATNHPPVITSEPITSVTAGETYHYTLAVTDSDNDQVTIKLTTTPDGLTIDGKTITWQPTAVGTYNVALEVSDEKGGYNTQAWQITVTAGAVSQITITPNDKPTIVDLGNHQQFTATANDQYGNPASTSGLIWSVDENIGTVDQNGLFVATHGGTGYVAVTIGTVKASNGVVVKDIRQGLAEATNTNSATNVNSQAAMTTVPSTTTNTNKSNTNGNTNSADSLISEATNSENTNVAEETTSTTPCTNWSRWIIITILPIYGIILLLYYMIEGRRNTKGWWIFPLLVSFIGIIIYFKYFCSGTYQWWPWVLVIIGLLVTVVLRRRSRYGDSSDISQNQLPF